MPVKPLVMLSCLAVFAVLTAAGPAAEEVAEPDIEFLKKADVGTQPAELAAFLRKHVPTDRVREQIETLVQQLAAERLEDRETATDKLQAIGVAALPFLRQASRNSHAEVSTRAQQLLAGIKGGTDPSVLAAAVRQLARTPAEGTVAVLLEFFPFAGEEWLEDDVLVALGPLSIRDGKPEQVLRDALKATHPARRGAAANLLARWGAIDQRPAVRALLADAAPIARALAARGLLAERYTRHDVSFAAEDRKALKGAGVGLDAADLLAFIRKQTLTADDHRRVERLLVQLDSDAFADRVAASRDLVAIGPPALGLLRQLLTGQGLEMTRRVELCIRDIEKQGPSPAVPTAAVRLLARRQPAEATQVLLDYIPYAVDAAVEEEVITALAQLAVGQSEVPAALIGALKDGPLTRRSAAAQVVGLVATREHCDGIKPLLTHANAQVRFRAAQGLLAARDRDAVATLIALLGEGPVSVAVSAEELLRRLDADKTPQASVVDPTEEGRKKAHEAWVAWWRDRGDRIDLATAHTHAYLGLTLVAELTSNNGTGGNRIMEMGIDGKMRWEVTGLNFPIDAHTLRGDRLLIAEYNKNRVIERDRAGKIVWEQKVAGNPVCCQRLANGNTLIATYTHVMEFTPENKEVYNHFIARMLAGQQVFNAVKLRNGNIACITGTTLLEIDALGKQIRSVALGNNGNWAGVEELPGGRFLVALMAQGKVREIDGTGKVLWEAAVPSACHAVRLANGNTLIASMEKQKVIEVNRAGKPVWEQTTAGRPFHVRRR